MTSKREKQTKRRVTESPSTPTCQVAPKSTSRPVEGRVGGVRPAPKSPSCDLLCAAAPITASAAWGDMSVCPSLYVATGAVVPCEAYP